MQEFIFIQDYKTENIGSDVPNAHKLQKICRSQTLWSLERKFRHHNLASNRRLEIWSVFHSRVKAMHSYRWYFWKITSTFMHPYTRSANAEPLKHCTWNIKTSQHLQELFKTVCNAVDYKWCMKRLKEERQVKKKKVGKTWLVEGLQLRIMSGKKQSYKSRGGGEIKWS